MANPKHVKIVKQGAEAIAKWREENPDTRLELSEADLIGAYLRMAILIGADFIKAKLNGANLRGTDLRGADLRGADLTGANLTGADLRGATLTKATLTGATLRGTVLSGAILIGVDFGGATLRDTLLDGADLRQARFWKTSFSFMNLSEPLGLEETTHDGPSEIGIHTIIRSKGKIPEVFLRGCGIPETWITQIPALIDSMSPIQFFSCFISYCTADEAFATRLHNDFRQAGISCWKWDHDARTGEDLFGEINQAIRCHDKVVLVVSEHSLRSPPVNREIERAIQEEDRRVKLKGEGTWKGLTSVLFPVRLDNYIFEEGDDGLPKWNPPRRADVVKKTIADGVGWEKDNEKYKEIRGRLIRDLEKDAAEDATIGKPTT